ncbi:nucleotidyltransferase domain-containing protein [Candidatus Woesearchaeota archaeon]|nr:nucleotidyltransferase domain-containing protein [Candidatus Woesearchaeota archaeon]
MSKNKPLSGKKVSAELFTAAARIMQWFFSFPDSDWTLTEVCEQTKTAKKTASPLIEEAIKKGLILKNHFGRSWRLMANKASLQFVRLKIASNLANIYCTPLVDEIRRAYPQARSITLFGSFRKGEDERKSDLDIAIELPGLSARVERFRTVTIGYRDNIKVNLLLFSRDKVDINLFANIANGIVLDGFLEVKP